MPLIKIPKEEDRVKLEGLINKYRWRGTRASVELYYFSEEGIIEKIGKIGQAGITFSEVPNTAHNAIEAVED